MAHDEEETKKRAAIRAQFPVDKPENDDDPAATLAWLKSQNRVHTLLLDRMPFAATVTDHQGRITYANPEAARLFGRPQHLLRGLDVMELLKDPEGGNLISEIRLLVAAYRDMNEVRVAVELPNHDLVYAQLSIASLLEDGVQVRVVGFLRNLTEIERVNRELKAANKREAGNRQQDAVTALYRREAFVERLRLLREVALKQGSSLGLVHVIVGNYTCQENDLPPIELVKAVANALRGVKEQEQIVGRVTHDGFTLLAPVIHAVEFPRLVRSVREAASITWYDRQGQSQPPAPIACDGLLCVGEDIPEAEAMLEQVEQRAVRARRDSGSFRLNIRKPS